MGSLLFKDANSGETEKKAEVHIQKEGVPNKIDNNKIRTDPKTKKALRTFKFAKELL